MAIMGQEDYRRRNRKVVAELNKMSKRLPYELARYLAAKARQAAPQKTGDTRRGIRPVRRGKGAAVISTVPGEFKQNLWTNETPPFAGRALAVAGDGKLRPPGSGSKKLKIGQIPGARLVRYSEVNRTAEPGWFDKAISSNKRYMRRVVFDHTKKALRALVR